MIKARFKEYKLIFRLPAGTSRGTLTEKISWFIFVYNDANPDISGIGECSPLRGLSIDDRPDFESVLKQVCNNVGFYLKNPKVLREFPSIRFGLEMAMIDLEQGGQKNLFPSDFTLGHDSVAINGLIWMGTYDTMQKQIREKIKNDFSCIKLKIGAIDFTEEIRLIQSIRKEFSESEIEIRLDANGAFEPKEALEKLNLLSEFRIHSIEQPVRQGNWEEMADLCRRSPVPVALDEELIGVNDYQRKKQLIDDIQPQYLILKPGLLGGFEATKEWVDLAIKNQIGWWITSALESNIGLNAIAQWTYSLGNKMPQGLGTGQLYVNNVQSPLKVVSGRLFFDPKQKWEFPKELE